MFDQTTLYTLNANTDNKRYSFFSMDAGIGLSTKDLWLFGGTGNFNSLGERHNLMDNIMYGVRDIHYPSFEHLNDVHIPLPNEGGDFMGKALEGALKARSIDDTEVCVDATGNTTKISFGATNCPDTKMHGKFVLIHRRRRKIIHIEKYLHLQHYLKVRFIIQSMNRQQEKINVILEVHIFVLQMMSVEQTIHTN